VGQRQQLEKLLVAGPERLGYEIPLSTCPWVADLIEQEFQVRYHEGHVWKILVGLGWSRSDRKGEPGSATMKSRFASGRRRCGEGKKSTERGRILAFIDETGLSQRPHRCRTWAPRGHTLARGELA
jgi:hypothetical protein